MWEIIKWGILIIIGTATLVAGFFWLSGFLKALWEHYPEIKKKINDYTKTTKDRVRITIDRIEHFGHSVGKYMLRVFGVKKQKEQLITQETVSAEKMIEWGYKGGDHYELTLKH